MLLVLLCALLQLSAAYVRPSLGKGALTASIGGAFGRSMLRMASSGGAPRSGGGGATKIDRRTAQVTSTKPSLKDEIEKDWRLIVHDDNIHTIKQVCEIISRTCPLCSPARAYEVTLETHMTGAGTVAVANKKIITEYTKSLQMSGLTVSMAPDDEFESDDDADE